MYSSVIQDEKRTAPFSEVEVFQKGKLKHVETEEKNPLPDAQSKFPYRPLGKQKENIFEILFASCKLFSK